MHSDCQFAGPSLTPHFTDHALPALLVSRHLYLNQSAPAWRRIQQGVRDFAGTGGPKRVLHHIVTPFMTAIGYSDRDRAEPVATRIGLEDGGYTFRNDNGASLRLWPIESTTELDAIPRRATAARVSPLRRSGRVLRACGEAAGIVTNGEALGLILCDPAGPDSHIIVSISGPTGWDARPDAPESYRLIAALASPHGLAAMNEIFDAARLHQTTVTKTLRSRARSAIEGFLCAVQERNHDTRPFPAAEVLWRQALTIVYRLLFILKMESSADPGGGFSFASTKEWRAFLSPNRALGPLARRHLDLGHDTGQLLEDGLRTLFVVCRDGLIHSALSIAPLGGGLFDPAATDALDRFPWGERAVALLLDQLLWTSPPGQERQRIDYGSLGVEELGRVYESLLDLEPDIATEPLMRVRHGKLESVVPVWIEHRRRRSVAHEFPPDVSICDRASDADPAVPITRPTDSSDI